MRIFTKKTKQKIYYFPNDCRSNLPKLYEKRHSMNSFLILNKNILFFVDKKSKLREIPSQEIIVLLNVVFRMKKSP